MECSEVKKSSQNVRVAVNIRPLITAELLLGCTDCITVVPGEPQVQIGSHTFTYDYVYGNMGSPSKTIYDDCVAPLVEALFHGKNATVLAYGQTGSGKNYTMGTNNSGEGCNSGVIPKAMESIFKRIDSMKESKEFLIRVSFVEIFKEEVFDLLGMDSSSLNAKPVVPARDPIQIKETVNGRITLDGVTEEEVKTKEEMASYLSRGSLSRATGSTNMNSQASRSHAIFTITMEQKNIAGTGATTDEAGDDILCAKLHLVDLAASEHAKRTGADGMRFKEGIDINMGLLVLGNVLNALGDEKKRKDGGHVPYRDSQLTWLLQDSLGGNSKTVMIACVSPADTNVEETLNTLKYANRPRNIQNKAVINRDPMAAQMQRMRSQNEQLQAENEQLQAENEQFQAEKLFYMSKIQELEGELLYVKNSHNLKRSRASDCVDTDDDGFQSKNVLFPLNEFSYECDTEAVDIPEKEQEHSSLKEKLDRELKELDKTLEQNETEIKRTIPKGSGQWKDFKTKKIFVGGLPQSVSEDELKNFFSKYGKVLEHQIIRDHENNRSRGFGFITFDSKEVVEEMLSNGNMIDMAGTQVEIKKAEPKKASNVQPPPSYGSNSMGHSFNDSFGGYGGSYGGFDGGFGLGYGGFGGSSLGGYRGWMDGYSSSSRYHPYGRY